MPINIYKKDSTETIDFICDEIWYLPMQLDTLEKWLVQKGQHLEPSKYIADIGFNIREDASGGGGILSSESMIIMGKIGMDVYFSEYPNF